MAFELYSAHDNGGETFDRYTLSFVDYETGESFMYGASEYPFHPQGFGQFAGDGAFPPEDCEIGESIEFEDLPGDVMRLAIQLTA